MLSKFFRQVRCHTSAGLHTSHRPRNGETENKPSSMSEYRFLNTRMDSQYGQSGRGFLVRQTNMHLWKPIFCDVVIRREQHILFTIEQIVYEPMGPSLLIPCDPHNQLTTKNIARASCVKTCRCCSREFVDTDASAANRTILVSTEIVVRGSAQ